LYTICTDTIPSIAAFILHLAEDFKDRKNLNLIVELKAVQGLHNQITALTQNTGATQGCVGPIPVHNDSKTSHYLTSNTQTTITLVYHNTVAHLTQWCGGHLHLNVSKSKDIIIAPPSPQLPILIRNG